MATYCLIPESHRESIARHLKRLLPTTTFDGPLRTLIATVRHAPSMELPEIHRFRDAHGHLFEISGWTQQDAQQRAERETNHAKPLSWEGTYIQWPGMPSVTLAIDHHKDHA